MKTNPHDTLIEILSRFPDPEDDVPAVTRAIKSVCQKYKQTNSKYIDKIVFLAASAFMVGDQPLAIELLDFVEEHVPAGKYIHLDDSLAMAVFLKMTIYEEAGKNECAENLSSKYKNISYSNLDDYTNPIFEIIEESEAGLALEEKDEQNSHSYLLQYSFDNYMSLVELSGRRLELKNRTNDGDLEYLAKAKESFREKFVFYLTEISTNSELKKYRASKLSDKHT